MSDIYDDELSFASSDETVKKKDEFSSDENAADGNIEAEGMTAKEDSTYDPYAENFAESERQAQLSSFPSEDESQSSENTKEHERDEEEQNDGQTAEEREADDFEILDDEVIEDKGSKKSQEDDADDYEDDEDSKESSPPPKTKNLADKIKRKNLWLVTGGVIVFLFILMLILPSIIPERKQKKTEEAQSSTAEAPQFLEYWEGKEKQRPVEVQSDKQELLPEARNEKELEAKIDAAIELESSKNKTPPPRSTGTGTSVSSRPETNRNEQQSRTMRMQINDGAEGMMQNQAGYSQTPYAAYGNSGNYGGYGSNYNNAVTERNQMLSQTLSSLANSQSQRDDGISGSQKNKQGFFKEGQGESGYQFNSLNSLWSGTIIPAVLVTAINTDLPGVVIARVTSNVYSSQNGKHLLIPEGTQLFATYNSSISYGQNRVQIAWNKMIRPDGLEMDLGNLNGVDARGQSGNTGHVNTHPFQLAKALGIISIFSILNTKYELNSSNNLYAQNAMADVYGKVTDMEKEIVDRALDIQPTITISSGTVVNLITNRTLDIPPMENFPVTQKYVRTR